MAKDPENNLPEHTRVYNNDRTDVDMEHFSRQVCEIPRKRSRFGIVLLLLFAAAAVLLYLVWGGKLPWM